MPRVIGIDPGTISIDICGLDQGRVFLDESLPTSDALRDPAAFIERLTAHRPVDLIAGPSGYGLPCVSGRDLTDIDLRLAFLAADGESGGIGGLRALARALARSDLPVVFTPGVIHLTSVPAHRKVNRVDMGTADKVCAAALAVREQSERRGCALSETAFVLLELGGAFTAAIAVDGGRIVDGIGGSSGPIGRHAAGALDGEVAFLAGRIVKSTIFSGGAFAVAGDSDIETLLHSTSPQHRMAWDAYIEGAIKAVMTLCASTPDAPELILSGRVARAPGVREELARRLASVRGSMSVEMLTGSTTTAMQAAHGAALVADGLAGGSQAELVDVLGVQQACGTVLDHLYVITQEQAKRTLGIA
jgi:predicted butyrate kinase (DUF1464 family)